MEPIVARKTWRTVEPVHSCVYFAPEAFAAYERLGLAGQQGYFASRAAPMGAVPVEVVIATFFNFSPAYVRATFAGAWARTTPDAVLAARRDAAGAALARLLGDGAHGAEIREAAELARTAALAACDDLAGRPLFAGHARLPWPETDEPHLVLWHAQSLLREYRGDGHVAILVESGLSGCEALVLHAATGELPGAALQATRGWTDAQWQAAVEGLAARGWVDRAGALTDAGRAARAAIEDRTDALAVRAYLPLGDGGCARLRELVRPLSRCIVASAEFGFGPAGPGAS